MAILTRKHDAFLAFIVATPLVAISLLLGDALYIGWWYYIAVPLVAFALSSVFKPTPLYQFGCALAICIVFLLYLRINWQASRPEGLLGLGHLFSLPLAMLGAIISSYFLTKKAKNPSVIIAFVYGLLGFGLGFIVNQILVCNTLMHCGIYSIF